MVGVFVEIYTGGAFRKLGVFRTLLNGVTRAAAVAARELCVPPEFRGVSVLLAYVTSSYNCVMSSRTGGPINTKGKPPLVTISANNWFDDDTLGIDCT